MTTLYWGPLLAKICHGGPDLNCTGNEDSVVQCKHLPWGDHNCKDAGAKHEWLGITCLVSILIFMLSRHISCHLEVSK